MDLMEQIIAFLQYKQIIANTQITEINNSLRSGTNGAIVRPNHSFLFKLKNKQSVTGRIISITNPKI